MNIARYNSNSSNHGSDSTNEGVINNKVSPLFNPKPANNLIDETSQIQMK